MRLQIEIESEDDEATEAPRHTACLALNKIIYGITNGGINGTVRDTNGNKIGHWEFIER